MQHAARTRLSAMLVMALMVLGMPMQAFATEAKVQAGSEVLSSPDIVYQAQDDYYKVVGKTDYVLAPGITESEIVLNSAAGSHRQVAHVVEVDVSNPYTKVMPSYKGMAEGLESKNYGVQIMSQQAAWAEANGYGNVVAAMNLSLSWYNSSYYTQNPQLVGEPLGYLVMDGVYYENSAGKTGGAQSCLVINFDEKDGVARPTDVPKTEIRATSSAITGWEEQVIPANFGFLVKDGVNQYSKDNNAANGASRSFVGIKADGTIVMVMNDGRQSPYSAGFTNYEMGQFMLSLGCVQAVNGDGGGSSTFLSQRPGEELKLNCSPSDGAERPTTHGILVISTAPADGQFARANITAEHDYYTPGSTVAFSALGTDLVGTTAEIPDDATWQLANPAMGTIKDGVFVSNGTVGTATAQMVWNGAVVGEASVEIVIPEALTFSQSVMTVPFGKEVTIALSATVNGGLNEVVLKESDIALTTTNNALGVFNGFKFTSVSEANAPADLTSTLTAVLKHAEGLSATATLSLGKGSEVLFDFESAEDVKKWSYSDVNGNDKGFVHELSFATAADGQVHDGSGSMRLYSNALSAVGVSAGGYAQLDLYVDEPVIVENAKSIGFWAYIPDEYEHCWIRVLYWYDSNNDGVFDKKNTVSVINQPEIYNTADENGWRYFSVDVSAYSKVLIPGLSNKENFAYNTGKNDANNFRFIEFMFPHTNTNDLWKTYGTLNGPYTIYVDNITADYSDAVDDREAPIFGAVNMVENETETALVKNGVVTTTRNLLNVTTTVQENTTKTNATGLDASSAKAYVDGVPVDFTFSKGRMSIADVAVADGVHRVKFEICDMMGNKSVVIRLIKVQSGVDASTIRVVPHDATLDRLYGGSVYWMDLKATDIHTIQSVSTAIDLNSVNHWELDHMVLADGFTGSYTIDSENNTATITITRTGANSQTGEAVLASLPIRVIYFDTDICMDGYTAETYWNTYDFWPQDLKVDVDLGEITYVEGYEADVLNAFSNEEFSVDTEMYAPSSGVDTAFKTQRGTAHVHTPEEMDAGAATCTKDGYTGRTFCNICDSIVDWGTETKATGHSFDASVDGVHTCENCDGVYYYVDGKAQTGWSDIDAKVYYFGADGAAVTGETKIDGISYMFSDYTLTAPALVSDGTGLIGYWAGEQMSAGWNVVNGKQYYVTGIYVNTGITKIGLGTNIGMRYHIFDENGVFQSGFTGVIEADGNLHFAKNGACAVKGLQKDDEGNFYYINRKYLVITNTYYTLNNDMTGGQIPAGSYFFGEDGKMVYTKNGLSKDADGEVRYYQSDVAVYAGLVQDADGSYYYINSSLKAVKNTTYYIYASRTNGLLPEGAYTFGPDGKMIVTKTGVHVDDDGHVRYYINDVAQYAGLVQDADGNYYYINSSLKAVRNTTYYIYASRTNGLLPQGTYTFGADGKMILPRSGLVKDADGAIRYYVDDVAVYAGLVQDADGSYYYINSSLKAVKNTTYYIYASRTNDLLPEGTYTFGADGKMILPRSGLVKDADGELRYYVDDVAVYAGLVQDADGNYYYINSSLKAVKNHTYTIYPSRANGLLEESFFDELDNAGQKCKAVTFDETGKMVKD